jgi:hypothetical protein
VYPWEEGIDGGDGSPTILSGGGAGGADGRREEIRKLYRERRETEEEYHTLKNKMKFERMTGKASIYVA